MKQYNILNKVKEDHQSNISPPHMPIHLNVHWNNHPLGTISILQLNLWTCPFCPPVQLIPSILSVLSSSHPFWIKTRIICMTYHMFSCHITCFMTYHMWPKTEFFISTQNYRYWKTIVASYVTLKMLFVLKQINHHPTEAHTWEFQRAGILHRIWLLLFLKQHITSVRIG